MGQIFVASTEYLNFIRIVENSHFNVCIFARRARLGFVRNSTSTVHSKLSIAIVIK